MILSCKLLPRDAVWVTAGIAEIDVASPDGSKSKSSQEKQVANEVLVVLLADTVANPRTVVVKLGNAPGYEKTVLYELFSLLFGTF